MNENPLHAALVQTLEAMKFYTLKCDFHHNRVLSKPMPTDADITRFRLAITAAEAVLKGENVNG